MKHKSVYIKSLSIIVLASLTMANKKCEKQEERQLKKNIKVVGMSASSFLDNSGFNFTEVSQNQLSGVFFDTNLFFERNSYPSVSASDVETFPVVTGASLKAEVLAEVNQKSEIQLKTWFPEMKPGELNLSQESSCMISRPQHLLLGKINALEAFGGGQLQFGFNAASVQLPISAKFKMDKMRMDLSMHAFDPWTQQKMGSVNSEAFKNDYAVGFGIDLGIIHIGPEFYRTTGMAEVTLKGLKSVVSDIYKTLAALPRQEWQSRVMLSRDNYVVIVGGAELGLKKGDRLKIENEVHDWMGEPCGESSLLLGSTSVTSNPWIVEIEDAGNLMSKAKVLNIEENSSIEVGALVRVDKLYVEPTKKSKKK
jgi:hypothetical protein